MLPVSWAGVSVSRALPVVPQQSVTVQHVFLMQTAFQVSLIQKHPLKS